MFGGQLPLLINTGVCKPHCWDIFSKHGNLRVSHILTGLHVTWLTVVMLCMPAAGGCHVPPAINAAAPVMLPAPAAPPALNPVDMLLLLKMRSLGATGEFLEAFEDPC
jgi:hypothetical protein